MFGATIVCGGTVTSSITLGHDLSCNGTYGLILGSDGITLDCAGHTISGNGNHPSAGITIANREGVTVKNCVVSNFGDGFELFNSSFNLLMDNKAINNFVSGFYLSSSFDSTMKSTGNMLKGNIAIGNGNGNYGGGGYDLFVARSTTLIGNTAIGNGGRIGSGLYIGNGFSIDASSGTVTGNVADANGWDGFFIGGSSSLTLSDNTASHNGNNGFDLVESTSNSVINNRAFMNNFFGFFFDGGSPGNIITNNTANSNNSPGSGFGDSTRGAGTLGTGNVYVDNKCVGRPSEFGQQGLC